MLRVISAMSLIFIAGCSSNLDAECADLFEVANVALGEVANARDQSELRVEVKKLEGLLPEVVELRKSAEERLNDSDFSSGLCAELAYRGQHCEENEVWDDLNKRKTMALAEFTTLWREVGTIKTGDKRVRSDPENPTFNQLGSKTLDELMKLSYLCNKTLR